jgi:polysaccharide pyruvyl transferase WcaK-like protein
VDAVERESRRRAVAVAVRDIPPSRGFTDRDAQRKAMVTNLARLLDAFVEHADADVVFVPFQTLPSSGLEARLDDVAISRSVIATMTHASRSSVAQVTDELALRAALSGYRVVLAQRFHAAIVALAAETPLVTLAYHDKFAGLEARHAGGAASIRGLIVGDIAPVLAAMVWAWESGATTAQSEGRSRARAAGASAAGVRALLAAIRPCDAAAAVPLRRPPTARR